MPKTLTAPSEAKYRSLYKILETLGLTEGERQLYLLALTLGPTPIATLAKHLGISRPNVYKLVTGLKRAGLTHFQGGKSYTKQFTVDSPTVIAEQSKQKLSDLQTHDRALMADMPELLNLYQQGSTPSKISLLTDHTSIQRAYQQMYEEADKEVLFYGSVGDFWRLIGEKVGLERIQRRCERRIFLRALVLAGKDADESKAEDEQEFRETRVLQQIRPFETSFHLFANKIIFWQPHTPLALLIEDSYLVTMFQHTFEALWLTAR